MYLKPSSDAKDPQGNDNYYPNVIYTKSRHIWWTKHNSSGSNWGNAVLVQLTQMLIHQQVNHFQAVQTVQL